MKEFLSQHQVPYVPKLLTDEDVRHEATDRNLLTAPLVVVGDREVHGYDEARLRSVLCEAGVLQDVRSPASTTAGSLPLAGRSLTDGIAIANFLGDSLTFLNSRDGSYLGPTLEASSLDVPGHPVEVQACGPAGTFISVNHLAGSVTLFSQSGGTFLRGSYENSTLASGTRPLFAVAHPRLCRFYVLNLDSEDLTVFDAAEGEYAFGDLETSRIRLPGRPNGMVLHPEANILYIRLREYATVMLDPVTLRPVEATIEASTIYSGYGRGLALSSDHRVLFAPQAVREPEGILMLDGRSGRPIFGTPEKSLHPTGPIPLGFVAHPSKPIVYVSSLANRTIEVREASTGEFLHGSAESSTIPVGGGARALAVDPRNDVLYASCFDEDAVFMFDAVTGESRVGDDGNPFVRLGRGPRGLCILDER